jgi:hypothetical protein
MAHPTGSRCRLRAEQKTRRAEIEVVGLNVALLALAAVATWLATTWL